MQMICALLLTINLVHAQSKKTDLLAQAQLIVPKATDYRLLSGPEEFCPGEGNILWRNVSDGPYLQLTPSMGFSGFGQSGWVNRPQGATLPDCVFNSKIEVTKRAILYEERESCPKEKWLRNLSIQVERKAELGLLITHKRAFTKSGKKEPDTIVKCELLLQKH